MASSSGSAALAAPSRAPGGTTASNSNIPAATAPAAAPSAASSPPGKETTASNVVLCQKCQKCAAIYQCPACAFKSCSLACCVSHKKESGCDGKRNRTSFLSLARMSDQTVTSDYFFLEDVLGQVETGKRLLRQVGAASSSTVATTSGVASGRPKSNKRARTSTITTSPTQQSEGTEDKDGDTNAEPVTQHTILQLTQRTASQNLSSETKPKGQRESSATAATGTSSSQSGSVVVVLPQQQQHQLIQHPKWRFLVRQAATRGTQLLLMPTGMTRHKENRSYYNKNKNAIFWTVEWLVYKEANDKHGARDDANIVLNNDLKPAAASSAPPQRGTAQFVESVVLWDALRNHLAFLEENGGPSLFSLLLKKLPCPQSQPTYVTISPQATLAEAVKDMVLFEYPTIYIVPNSRLSEFPRAIEELSSS